MYRRAMTTCLLAVGLAGCEIRDGMLVWKETERKVPPSQRPARPAGTAAVQRPARGAETAARTVAQPSGTERATGAAGPNTGPSVTPSREYPSRVVRLEPTQAPRADASTAAPAIQPRESRAHPTRAETVRKDDVAARTDRTEPGRRPADAARPTARPADDPQEQTGRAAAKSTSPSGREAGDKTRPVSRVPVLAASPTPDARRSAEPPAAAVKPTNEPPREAEAKTPLTHLRGSEQAAARGPETANQGESHSEPRAQARGPAAPQTGLQERPPLPNGRSAHDPAGGSEKTGRDPLVPVVPPGPPAGSIAAVRADLERRVAAEPDDLDHQLRLRMLYLVDGQDDRALADTPGMNPDLQELVRRLVRTWIAARGRSGEDPATWATRQLAGVNEWRGLLRARADLSVPVVALCTHIESFGRYDPIEPPEFVAGVESRAVLYAEVQNFRTEPTGAGEYRSLLAMRTTLLTAVGREIWSTYDDNIEDQARRPREDFFLSKLVLVPETLDSGEYLLKVQIEDKLAGKANGNQIRVRLVAPANARAATDR